MNIDKLEYMAFRHETMPDSLSLYAQMFFQAMRMLYLQLHNDYIDRECAIEEKKKIVAQYQKQLRQERFYSNLAKLQADFFRQVECAASQYARTRTLEAADKFYQAVYKVQMKKQANF